jgi:hypothetical protein
MAGKNKYFFVDAELEYAKVFEANRDMGNEQVDHSDTDGVYTVNITVDEDTKNRLIEGGFPAKQGAYETFKAKGDGKFGYKARRPHKHAFWTVKDENGEDTGKPVIFGPPRVFDYNQAAKAWEDAGRAGKFEDYITAWTIEDGLIGNGSKATVKLKVENGVGSIGKAKGKPFQKVTLEAIALKDVVVYEKENAEWY